MALVYISWEIIKQVVWVLDAMRDLQNVSAFLYFVENGRGRWRSDSLTVSTRASGPIGALLVTPDSQTRKRCIAKNSFINKKVQKCEEPSYHVFLVCFLINPEILSSHHICRSCGCCSIHDPVRPGCVNPHPLPTPKNPSSTHHRGEEPET